MTIIKVATLLELRGICAPGDVRVDNVPVDNSQRTLIVPQIRSLIDVTAAREFKASRANGCSRHSGRKSTNAGSQGAEGNEGRGKMHV